MRQTPGSSTRRMLGPLIAFVVFASFELTQAEDVCDPLWKNANTDPSAFQKLAVNDCLGGPNDRSDHIADLLKAIDLLPGLEDATRLTSALDIMGTIQSYLIPATPEGPCRDALMKGIASINNELLVGTLVPPSDAECIVSTTFHYKPTCWELDPSVDPPSIPGVKDVCKLNVPGEVSLAQAAAVARLAAVVRGTLGGLFAPLLKSYHAEAVELRGRWWTYFHETRTQYPWELGVNAFDFKRRISDAKTKGLFHGPPNHQWIVAHPEASLEYFRHAPDGEQFKPALTVELVGFNGWKWNGEKTSRAVGVAVVSNYSDVATIPDWRFGLVLHVAHKYSFGATRGSGDTGYFVSADLVSFITDKQKKAKSFLEKLKEKAPKN